MDQSFRRSLPASPELARKARRWITVLEAMGMTRRSIAAEAGVAPSTITRLAAGQLHLTRVTARRLLAAKFRL